MEFKEIIDTRAYNLVGMVLYGDPFNKKSPWNEENEIGELWKRFNQFYASNGHTIKNLRNNAVVEIHFETPESKTKGYFEVFAGVIVDSLEGIPLSCVAKQLPLTQYAVFTIKGEEIVSDWVKSIYYEWLPSSGYELGGTYSITFYDERFKGMDNINESEIEVYIPIAKKIEVQS